MRFSILAIIAAAGVARGTEPYSPSSPAGNDWISDLIDAGYFAEALADLPEFPEIPEVAPQAVEAAVLPVDDHEGVAVFGMDIAGPVDEEDAGMWQAFAYNPDAFPLTEDEHETLIHGFEMDEGVSGGIMDLVDPFELQVESLWPGSAETFAAVTDDTYYEDDNTAEEASSTGSAESAIEAELGLAEAAVVAEEPQAAVAMRGSRRRASSRSVGRPRKAAATAAAVKPKAKSSRGGKKSTKASPEAETAKVKRARLTVDTSAAAQVPTKFGAEEEDHYGRFVIVINKAENTVRLVDKGARAAVPSPDSVTAAAQWDEPAPTDAKKRKRVAFTGTDSDM